MLCNNFSKPQRRKLNNRTVTDLLQTELINEAPVTQ
jgi:hypothetical protein